LQEAIDPLGVTRSDEDRYSKRVYLDVIIHDRLGVDAEGIFVVMRLLGEWFPEFAKEAGRDRRENPSIHLLYLVDQEPVQTLFA